MPTEIKKGNPMVAFCFACLLGDFFKLVKPDSKILSTVAFAAASS